VAPDRLARVSVALEAREVRRGHVDADPVAASEQVAGRRKLELDPVGRPRRHHHLPIEALAVASADDRVVDQHVVALGVILIRGVDVDELRGEVRVDRARGDPQLDLDRPGHLDGLLERLGLVDEHVGPLREPPVGRPCAEVLRRLLLVCRAGGHDVPQPERGVQEACPHRLDVCPLGGELAHGAIEAADRRHRVVGVVGELPRLRAGRRRPRPERPVRVQVEGRRGRPREWPLVFVTPPAAVVELAERRLAAAPAAHHEDPHRLAVGGPTRRAATLLPQPAVEILELLVEVALNAPA